MNNYKPLDPHQKIQFQLILLILTVAFATFITVLGLNSKQAVNDTRVDAFSKDINVWGKFFKGGLPCATPQPKDKKENPDNITDCTVCDINKDGVSNHEDMTSVINCYLQEACPEADLNQDGVVDYVDMEKASTNRDPEMMKKVRQCLKEKLNFKQVTGSQCLPDINGDGENNQEDIVTCIRSCQLPNKNRLWKTGPTVIPLTGLPNTDPTPTVSLLDPTITPDQNTVPTTDPAIVN
jgi:hypothetical protein